ncbi:MAG: phage tail protein [Saprospiraceae bacterium]|nr:phage tail protein [Saprospiraceae bacterium]
MEPFIGQIIMFGGNFDIRGYASCRGQLLSIAQNTALFSILGTMYGGDGRTTFGLPNLQGRVPIGQGQGAGLPSYDYGQVGGSPNVTLLTSNLPAHNHPFTGAGTVQVSDTAPNTEDPAGGFLTTAGNNFYSTAGNPGLNLGGVGVTGAVGLTGNNAPVDIMQPYLAISYQIALQGIFPPRN